MNNKGKEIERLLETVKAPATDATKPLKNIGDGNMFDGIRNLYDYAETEGEKKGIIEGALLTLATSAVTFLVYNGIIFVKHKIAERNSHTKMGQKIYDAFDKELTELEDVDKSFIEDTTEKSYAERGEFNADLSRVWWSLRWIWVL